MIRLMGCNAFLYCRSETTIYRFTSRAKGTEEALELNKVPRIPAPCWGSSRASKALLTLDYSGKLPEIAASCLRRKMKSEGCNRALEATSESALVSPTCPAPSVVSVELSHPRLQQIHKVLWLACIFNHGKAVRPTNGPKIENSPEEPALE
jgi:hypothetical protein